MKKVQWLPTDSLTNSTPDELWVKVEYVVVGASLRMKAVIRATLRRQGYGPRIDPDLQDLLNLNRNAAVTEDWNPNDGKDLVHVTDWTARLDEVRPNAFSLAKPIKG